MSATKPPAIQPGIYMTYESRSAIVYRVARTTTYFVTMMDGVIEHKHMHHADFLRLFTRYLPNYPMRRAVRIYHNSTLSKTEVAERTLRALLQH